MNEVGSELELDLGGRGGEAICQPFDLGKTEMACF